MKKKTVEAVRPIRPHKAQTRLTWQQASGILIMDLWDGKEPKGRYCIDMQTHEYAFRDTKGTWLTRKLVDVCGISSWDEKKRATIEHKTELDDLLLQIRGDGYFWESHTVDIINRMERDFNADRRDRTEQRRRQRVQELMDMVPERPGDMEDWIDRMETGGMDWMLQDKDSGLWCCSHCGSHHYTEVLEMFGKLKNGKPTTCPECGAHPIVRKRGAQRVEVNTHCSIFQKMANGARVLRHFDVLIRCTTQERKAVWLSESVRMVFFPKYMQLVTRYRNCDLYYNQYRLRDYYGYIQNPEYGYITAVDMDNRANPGVRSMREEYLYPSGDIAEILQGTKFEAFTRTMEAAAAAGFKLNYNRILSSNRIERMAGITEMLLKGRFNTLFRETAEAIDTWDGEYRGPLRILEDDLEGIFGINDRQLINRIREKDGGYHAVKWMQWSNREGRKLTDKAFDTLLKEKLTPTSMERILKHMSPEAAVNYLGRQARESYRGKSLTHILNQYDDYFYMINKLGKDMDDEMNYKPRELKRRHDEAVQVLESRKAELKADEMRKRFPGAEEALAEMTQKLTWEDDMYLIRVPKQLTEIVVEGNMLHHCAGASDRYFDRIKTRETFICFLRKKSEPDKPFYTIEVEPGGTIRQHRGAYDEEPDIENIKPHLKAWQKEIRRRMSREDHQLAEKSKELRQANIEDLRMRNNTRVLQGLMEDFMEAEEEDQQAIAR